MTKIDFSKFKDIPPLGFYSYGKTVVDMAHHEKWKIPEKVLIQIAPVGLFFMRDQNPYQPYTTEEIIKEAIESVEAGAAAVHVHVRNADGSASDDRHDTEKVIKALRDKFGADVYIDGEALMGPDLETMMEPITRNYYESAAVSCWAAFMGDSLCYLPPPTCKAMAEVIQAYGKKITIAAYNPGDIDNAYRWLIKPGIVKPPFMWGLTPGMPGASPMYDPIGMAETLIHMIRRIRDIDDCEDSIIQVCQSGRASTYLSTLAILLGCHIRIGKEDTTVKWPHKDDYIVSCKEEVEKHVAIARLLGREPMTAVEYRQVLGLPPFAGSF
jgi:3-keto-5-aminohexanoate cleavage enzyme